MDTEQMKNELLKKAVIEKLEGKYEFMYRVINSHPEREQIIAELFGFKKEKVAKKRKDILENTRDYLNRDIEYKGCVHNVRTVNGDTVYTYWEEPDTNHTFYAYGNDKLEQVDLSHTIMEHFKEMKTPRDRGIAISSLPSFPKLLTHRGKVFKLNTRIPSGTTDAIKVRVTIDAVKQCEGYVHKTRIKLCEN